MNLDKFQINNYIDSQNELFGISYLKQIYELVI
jgi:hypothetical protein